MSKSEDKNKENIKNDQSDEVENMLAEYEIMKKDFSAKLPSSKTSLRKVEHLTDSKQNSNSGNSAPAA